MSIGCKEVATLLVYVPASEGPGTSKSRLCLRIKPELMMKSHNTVNYGIFIRVSLCLFLNCLLF